MHERHIGLSGLAIIKNGVSRAESATRTVLPGQSDRDSFEQKRSESQSLGVMPFIRSAFLENFAAMIEDDSFDLGLNVKIIWNAGESIHDRLQHFLADGGGDGGTRVFRLKNRGRSLEFRLLVCLLFFYRFHILQRDFQSNIEFGFQRSSVV